MQTYELVSDFVHEWFADLDELKPSEQFWERITEDFLFDIYGNVLYGHRGFLSVYASMQKNSEVVSRHTATNIQLIEDTDEEVKVRFDIALEQHHPSGRISSSESEEEWVLRRNFKGGMQIQSYAIIAK